MHDRIILSPDTEQRKQATDKSSQSIFRVSHVCLSGKTTTKYSATMYFRAAQRIHIIVQYLLNASLKLTVLVQIIYLFLLIPTNVVTFVVCFIPLFCLVQSISCCDICSSLLSVVVVAVSQNVIGPRPVVKKYGCNKICVIEGRLFGLTCKHWRINSKYKLFVPPSVILSF